MKLYYAKQTCSMGIHLLLEEIGSPFDKQALSFAANEQRGPEFLSINPKGKVPTLVAGEDGVITEFPAIAFYLGERFPEAVLLPATPLERVRAFELMDFAIATMHMRGFSRMFKPEGFSEGGNLDAVRAHGRAIVDEGFAWLSVELGNKEYLLDEFTVADASVFILEWWANQRLDIALPPNLAGHFSRLLRRPSVMRMLATEGLVVEAK